MFERYSQPSRLAVLLARNDAYREGRARITLLHLTRAVLSVAADSLSREVLTEAGIDPLPTLQRLGGDPRQLRDSPPPAEIPLESAAREVLFQAAAEADDLADYAIGPEHLLLAIAQSPDSPLRPVGIAYEALRHAVVRLGRRE